jgi:hypothetical protein
MIASFTIITFPVFDNYAVHIEKTSDIMKSMEKYPATKHVEPGEHTEAITVHVADDPCSYIFLPHNAAVGTIAHEAWHVVRRMLEYVGADLENENVAYHLGFLVNRIFKFIRGRGRK